MATVSYSKFHKAISELIVKLGPNLINITNDYAPMISIAFLSLVCNKFKDEYDKYKVDNNIADNTFESAVRFFQNFGYVKLEYQKKVELSSYLSKVFNFSFEDFCNVPFKETSSYILNFTSRIHSPFDFDSVIETPSAVCEIASNILNINENDDVAEFCGGVCNFSQTLIRKYTPKSLTAYEINNETSFIASIISEVIRLQSNNKIIVKINNADVLDENLEGKFSKIFCDIPINYKVPLNTKEKKQLVEDINEENDEYAISEIIFIKKILNSLKEGGKACVIIMTHFLTAYSYVNLIRYLVDNRCISDVIQFTPKISYPGTHVSYSLLVLSKPNTNSSINMIDATNEFNLGALKTSLTRINIEAISKAYLEENNSPMKKKIDYSSLQLFYLEFNNHKIESYNVLPQTYFIETKERDSSLKEKKFTEIFSIYRGVTIPIGRIMGASNPIDERIEDENTCYYLNQSDITSTKINDNFPIFNIEVQNDTALVQSEDLLICSTKSGKALKVGYGKDIKDINHKKVYASSNLYIARKETRDEELYVNPLYIKAFLEKEDTYKYLNSINPGIKLYLKSLDNLSIPLPDKKTQDDIAKKYADAIQKINDCEKQLEDANNNLDSLLNDI